MSAMEPTHAVSGHEHANRRRWRRRQIMTTYASYVGLVILMAIRSHVTPGSGAGAAVFVAFGFSGLAFIASLLWMVGPSVRYAMSERSYRQPAPGELKRLKAQGASAKQVEAMYTRPADERQRAIREHAQAVSYQILGPIIIIAIVYYLLVTSFFNQLWLPSSHGEQFMLLVGVTLLIGTLPSAVVAWSEPDPIPDDVS